MDNASREPNGDIAAINYEVLGGYNFTARIGRLVHDNNLRCFEQLCVLLPRSEAHAQRNYHFLMATALISNVW